MKLIEDLGMVFVTEASKQKRRMGLFECPECYRRYTMNMYHTISKGGKICISCVTKKNKTTHGGRYHKLYGVWSDERDRCNRSTHKHYHLYGGRGITMSEEFSDFSKWLEYVSSLPAAGTTTYTIDRIDNNKGYERGNLRWASKNTQAHNTKLIRTTNKSGYRGVISTKTGKFSASIGVNSKKIHLGTYITALDAAKAYDQYIIDNDLEHTQNGVING